LLPAVWPPIVPRRLGISAKTCDHHSSACQQCRRVKRAGATLFALEQLLSPPEPCPCYPSAGFRWQRTAAPEAAAGSRMGSFPYLPAPHRYSYVSLPEFPLGWKGRLRSRNRSTIDPELRRVGRHAHPGPQPLTAGHRRLRPGQNALARAHAAVRSLPAGADAYVRCLRRLQRPSAGRDGTAPALPCSSLDHAGRHDTLLLAYCRSNVIGHPAAGDDAAGSAHQHAVRRRVTPGHATANSRATPASSAPPAAQAQSTDPIQRTQARQRMGPSRPACPALVDPVYSRPYCQVWFH